jgi:hypothetical protein
MRRALQLGVPIAAGLATGGYALSQGEDPGSAILAGAAGGLGAYGGLIAARDVIAPRLAGKYGKVVSGLEKVADKIDTRRLKLPAEKEEGLRSRAYQKLSNAAISAGVAAEKYGTERNIGKAAAAGLVPASALAAGLGGVALGAIPGAMNVPGFQQGGAIDPESPYVSSNTQNAKYGVTSYASTQYA